MSEYNLQVVGRAVRNIINAETFCNDDISEPPKMEKQTQVYQTKKVASNRQGCEHSGYSNPMQSLLFCGNYEHIIKQVLTHVSANDLASLQYTCPEWDKFIEKNIWNDPLIMKALSRRWGAFMPKHTIKAHGKTIYSMKCDARYIVCGEEKTGQVKIYKRNDVRSLGDLETHLPSLKPAIQIDAHKNEFSVTSVDLEDDLLLTGSGDGSVKAFSLKTGKQLSVLSQSAHLVQQVKILNNKVYITAGNKVTVQVLSRRGDNLDVELTHVLDGHEREVLCLDANNDKVITGSMDKSIKLYRLGPVGLFRVIHTLKEHTQKVRCIALHGQLAASGSWDHTARLWDLNAGTCIRTLKHEMLVRSIALDDHRILTGDNEGYVYAWDVQNCKDQQVDSGKLCLRAIPAAYEINMYGQDRDKRIVYAVHLEPACAIQVAGTSGRIVINDFWNHDGYDHCQLESFQHEGSNLVLNS